MAGLGAGAAAFVAVNISNYLRENGTEIAFKAGYSAAKWLVGHWGDCVQGFADYELLGSGFLSDGLEHVLDFSVDAAEGGLDLLELGVDVADAASDGVDLLEGASTLGASVLLGWGVKKIFQEINREEEEQLKALECRIEEAQRLKLMALKGAPAEMIADHLERVDRFHWDI